VNIKVAVLLYVKKCYLVKKTAVSEEYIGSIFKEEEVENEYSTFLGPVAKLLADYAKSRHERRLSS